MSKFTVSFIARKGSNVIRPSVTVECENEREAILLAETKAKNMNPLYRDYDWGPEKIVKK